MPGLAFCPSKSLMPRYFGLESLPNFVAPVAFVVDIYYMLAKLLKIVKRYKKDIILLITVFLISLLSFAAGYITYVYKLVL